MNGGGTACCHFLLKTRSYRAFLVGKRLFDGICQAYLTFCVDKL